MQPSIPWSSSVSAFVIERMAIIHSLKYNVLFSFVVPLLSLIAICCHLLSLIVSLVVTPYHSLYHSLSLVVILCHSLSLVVTRCYSLSLVVIRCYSLYHSLSVVFIRCHSLYYSLSLVVIRCPSLSLDVPLVCLFINNQIFRSGHLQLFFKIGVLKIFALITGKHLCWSLFLIKWETWIIEAYL